ncbi:hypothetical protein GCM10027440_36960 [Nocardiopsis coralliicola]
MGHSERAGKARRGAHRSEPEHSGPLATVGHMLESTVPKRVQPPRLLNVFMISAVTLTAVLFGYSTTQIYLRFSEPPVEHGSAPPPSASSEPGAAPDGATGEADPGVDSPRAGAEGAGAARINYSTVEESTAGFTGEITLTNTSGEEMAGWELVLGFSGATVTAVWDVDWEATENGVVARQPADTEGIPPGDSVIVGFTAEGAPQEPETCTLNGAPCTL